MSPAAFTSDNFHPNGAAPRPPIKCLLVDDLEENLLALSALLQAEDVQLLKARSAAEALELLLLHDFALAFLDVQMPETDGFQLAELMRGSERTRHVPIIFVTAGSQDQQRLFKGYDSGGVDFLYKPLDPRIVKNKADVFFQLYRQRQQLAQELIEKTETLRLNEIFTAVLGHDLRNPLSVIFGFAQLLQRNPDAAVQNAASKVLANGKLMERMIEDILDLARARLAGGIPVKRGEADLGLLVQRVVQEYQMAFTQHRFEIVQEGDLCGEWDADRLLQAATNLLGNAVQHGDAGHPVYIRLDGRDADRVALTVTNTGTIPAELLPHIFDPFRSGRQKPTNRNRGLGLGLYIAQQIVKAHLGSIEVKTDTAITIFRICIPRRAAASSPNGGATG
jgi:signal transduction histidine kinase